MTARPPLILAADSTLGDEIARELVASGLRVVHDTAGATAERVAVLVDATTLAGARAAVLAAANGAAVIAIVDPNAPAAARLHEDLRRIGPVEVRRRPAPGPVLTDQQRRLLELLAGGSTLDEAALSVHVSRRTAVRRLAEARRALGVLTTAEAAALMLGRGSRPER
jgi:DNA-binding NarL/FixJ family response regulator